ncbi:MAG: HIT family protein [Gammaproteobacteria bacterium]
MNKSCPLCNVHPENILWSDAHCRVVLIKDADYPVFCRVVWNSHVKEMTDLAPEQRNHLMNVVFAVESVLRELLTPAKINLASLGNQTPHIHWHVIPRYEDDAHFPNPVWSERLRNSTVRIAPELDVLQSRLSERLG